METRKNTSKRWIAGLSAALALSLLLSSCLKNSNNYYVPPAAYVSFYQAIPNAQPLDIYFDNNKVNAIPINYSDGIDYFRAYTGKRTVNFYTAGSTTKIFSDSVHLNQDMVYSLFLTNTLASPSLLLLTDSLSQPPAGMAKIRFVNVSPDAPAVDFAVKDSTALVTNKAFKGYSSFVPIKGNSHYIFEVRQKGTNTVLATSTNANLLSGFVYTIWFHGLANSVSTNDKLAADIVTNAYYY